MRLLKKEVKDTNQFDILKELDLEIQQTQTLNGKDKVQSLIVVIKNTLGKIFFLNKQYTYEELMSHIETFEDILGLLEKDIEKLNNEHDELIHKEKGAKKDRNLIETLRQLNSDIESKQKDLERCRNTHEQLEDINAKNRVTDFCKHLSKMQFSPDAEEINYHDLLYDFLWIVNRFNYEGNLIHYDVGSSQEFDENSLNQLLEQTKKNIEEGNFQEGNMSYNKALALYLAMDKKEQEEKYPLLFNIWFDLHYHPDLEHSHFNTT